ncbi:MAG TPA: hypothetical protein VFA16_18350 [Mycobacterium sp.]|uniref:hypothetical protein n=1 Tax=Mycobacterium sp. TaxID=1785 RepID=UPI002D56493E|nr:hypothetical protein [Mycobacterium sp.]HZU49189.1 hypothetical protein [Mycobacterium sp.]
MTNKLRVIQWATGNVGRHAVAAVHDHQGCLGTTMHTVHAIAPVCAAAPGIRTFLDLPTIVGRGVLTKGRS